MTDTDTLEQYIYTTFSKITDDQDRPLDVSAALPLLKQVLTGYTQQVADYKFNYIGESAVQFAIHLILADHFSKYENRVLSSIAKKFTVPLQLYKLIGKQIHLKEYVRPIYLKETLDMVFGILFRYNGIMAVQKFIQDEFISLVNHDLNNAASPKKSIPPSSLTNQAENPVKVLYELIQANGGILETESHETDDKRWQVKIVAKFNEKSLLFSHARTSSSKQKAKTEASRDILTYFTNNPDVCQHLQVPAAEGASDIHMLAISENDYCHLFTENTTNTRPALKTSDWGGERLNLSQASHEDATLLMENLFLDSKMDVDMDPRQVKRQRQSTQELSGSAIVKTESSEHQQPLISPSPTSPLLQQPTNTMESNVTYIKDEETFRPFNQPPEAPMEEAAATRQEKILKYFRKLFAPHRLVLLQCRTNPGQSKTLFLSFVVQHQDELFVDITVQQGGDSHTPIFRSEVVLRSKTKLNAFLKTEGHGRRKRDAEQQAFNKMIEIVTNWNSMI
ncbi:hypothetical protein MAM1_0051d03399 [Mucor ambiguus]|uniref:DRBM domain-containing protein n=1 Tax=Mucor ambiguus TaxID=91626 RepID=A0A0C9MPH9_9FUNG|nr:hypothetical protein MAM1_0051d03399 [Mucor ambiguus]